MAWESLEIPLTLDLLIRAEFEIRRGKVKEFKIVLHRLEKNGQEEWILRYETHGGRAHKHVRWDDEGETRHKHPKGWRGSHAELVTQALHDLRIRFEEYEARYEAWARKNEAN